MIFQVLTPVIDLKSKTKDEEESNTNISTPQAKNLTASLSVRDFDWNVANEYDPMWPNDYEKVAKGKSFKMQKKLKFLVVKLYLITAPGLWLLPSGNLLKRN